MSPSERFKANLKTLRPNQYRREKEKGTLDQLADQAEQGYLTAVAKYSQTISRSEAMQLAEQDWLMPISEAEEKETQQRLKEQESQERETQATQMLMREQGYDPNNRKPQRFNLGNGKTMTKMPGLEMVYPSEIIESNRKRLAKDPQNPSTDKT